MPISSQAQFRMIRPSVAVATLTIAAVLFLWVAFNRLPARPGELSSPAESASRRLRLELNAILASNAALAARLRVLREEGPSRRPINMVTESKADGPFSMALLQELASERETIDIVLGYFDADQERRFRNLYGVLKLPPEKESALRKLMAERLASRVDIAGLKMSGENTANAAAGADQQFAESLAKILSADEVRLVLDIDRRLPIWDQVNRLERRFRHEGSGMERDQLIAIMNDWKSVPVSSSSNEMEVFNRVAQRNVALLANTSRYLSPAQVAVLTNFLDDEKHRQLHHLRLSKAMVAR